MQLGSLPNGGVAIDYEAATREEGLKHREHSMLGLLPDGREELVVAMAESPHLVRLVSTDGCRFVEVEGFGPYEIAIEITVSEDELTYAYWWAERGGVLTEQSRAAITLR